jgi:hypothetical protein
MMNLEKGGGKPLHSSSAVIDVFFQRTASWFPKMELLVQGKSPCVKKMMV